jgi:hypothetical protein
LEDIFQSAFDGKTLLWPTIKQFIKCVFSKVGYNSKKYNFSFCSRLL